ncbi:MAG: thiolase family protein [Frankia sp.]|nr:thiolase family protein [Frankia sp.]
MAPSDVHVAIIGVGLHPFGRYPGRSALEMGEDAVIEALRDAGVDWPAIQVLYAGSMEVKNPEAITALLGMTGIPARAVFTGCATGGTSLAMAANAIRLGEADIALAVGLDKHPRGAFSDHPSVSGLPDWYGEVGLFLTTHFFGMKINRYMHDFGITPRTLARAAAKAFRNGAANPRAWRRTPLTEEQILESPYLNYPLTQYMYCGPNEGAAAAVLCRADIARRYTDKPVYLLASQLFSRREGAFEVLTPSLQLDAAPSPTVFASKAAYEQAGVGPEDVDVAQLQDTDAGSEIIHMAENGFCADGEQEKLLAERATEIGGRIPVNTDGGLLANGEPVGASGLRQVYELVNQLRGRCGDRQVENARVGYAQLYGAPGTAAVTILSA